jgi:hypothetical protein
MRLLSCASFRSLERRRPIVKTAMLVVVLVALLTIPAAAGQNPNIQIYLDVDPPNFVNEVYPDPSATFDVYVCVTCFGPDGGTRGTAFLLTRTFEGFKLSQTNLLGGLDFGDAEGDGWTMAAGADCVYPDLAGVVCVGVIQYLYMAPGTLDIGPHPGTGREVLDCDFQSDFYCIRGHLGVGAAANPGEDCDCPSSPVNEMTWGRLKAMYR